MEVGRYLGVYRERSGICTLGVTLDLCVIRRFYGGEGGPGIHIVFYVTFTGGHSSQDPSGTHTQTYTFQHFCQVYLVLNTMSPHNS